MALKTFSFKSEDQQLYMLELLVDRLNLVPEKIEEIDSTPLSVSLQFLNFPVFEVSEEEFWSPSERKEKEDTLSSERKDKNGSLDFSAGKTYLFPMKPNELVEAMRTQPLKVDVHKAVAKKAWGPRQQETFICKSEVPLSGCLCDQLAMAANDASHLPKPYTLRNTWNLIDEQGKPSGTILLLLRLTCLGKSITTQFAVQEKFLLFKNCNSFGEFLCGRVNPDVEGATTEDARDEICVPKGYVQPELHAYPKTRSVVGLAPICRELAKRDGGPLEIVPSAKMSEYRAADRKANSKINMNEAPSTQRPVHARQVHYTFQKTETNKIPCTSGCCSGEFGAGSRNFDPRPKVHHGPSNFSQTRNCCCGQNSNLERKHNCVYKSRMRGGGRSNEDFEILKSQHTIYPAGGTSRDRVHSVETLISGVCKSPKNEANSKPGCGCYGKLGTGIMETNSTMKSGGCCNKPCQGVDCLIQAFKETQNFVDSIGKVPGLAGLGLMDPAESPYFGRERNDVPTSCTAKGGALATNIVKQTSSTYRPGIRSQHGAKRAMEGKTINTILPAPGTGRVVASHPDVHSFHEMEKKKAEEKHDKHRELPELLGHQASSVGTTGRCGTPRCKPKKKTLQNETLTDQTVSNSQVAAKKLTLSNKSLNLRRTRMRGKMKPYANLDPVGYPLSGQQNSYIRVSRRVMKLVNAIRDPRFCYGHKNCLDVRLRVPKNMGWLWNTNEVPGRLKPSIGWKPGAVSKFVWDRLQEAKAVTADSTTNDSRPSTPGKGKRNKALKGVKSFSSINRSPWIRSKLHDMDDEEVELPPTLHIHRKDGTYYVTMYPVKAENINEPELQEKVKPLQFKITKNKEDGSACSSSSASDIEIEFSPPAAINRYKKKDPVKDQDTQVSHQEILDTLKVTNEKQQSDKSKKAKTKK